MDENCEGVRRGFAYSYWQARAGKADDQTFRLAESSYLHIIKWRFGTTIQSVIIIAAIDSMLT